jgi:cellulose synthase operon protein B
MSRAATPLAIVAALLASLSGAVADSGAFDMSTERPYEAAPLAAPADATPIVGPAATTPTQKTPSPADASNAIDATPAAQRAILPFEVLRLSGEVDSRSWTVDLTRGESESPTTLSIGYKSALVVAPESSRLRVLVNDRLVLEGSIAASEQLGRLSIKLPGGLLRPGANLFRAEVSQRHRTDCSVASTYELWTEIYSSDSALHFEAAAAAPLRLVEDLGAAGVDQHGVAHLRIVAPALGQAALARILLRFAQGAAVLVGEPNQTVSVIDRASAPSGPGVLTAVIGTYGDLQPVLRSLPPEAATRPLAAFVDDPNLGPSTLAISGPTMLAVSQAADSIVSLADDPLADQRLSIATSHWFAPNAPMARGAARYKLSELGARTQEFSGRRFKTEFMVGLPSDFYASAYGEATLLLDAAYSGEVLPGSHLDVFVNDQITATAPITTSGGEILRHLPIRMLMTHFKPGPNLIRFEAQLNTAADQLCRTGGAANLSDRFAIFDTSEFVTPDFARIARRPDLAALMGSGFPYSRAANPTALVMNEADSDTVSAAATLLARMAVAGGRTIALDLASPTAIGERNAIFIASADQTPSEVLAQLGIDQSLSTAWKAPSDDLGVETADVSVDGSSPSVSANAEFPAPDELDTQATFRRWRNALSDGGGWRGNVSAFQDWLQRTFQFSAASLRFLPSADVAFDAPRGSTVLLAQGENPSGNGAWTLLTAPTSKLLRQGAEALTAQKQWSQLSGHLVSYNGKTGALTTQPVTTFSFLVTEPLSLSNLRLIIANWLSDNILTYSVLLLFACVLLGLVTARFLSRIGRGST